MFLSGLRMKAMVEHTRRERSQRAASCTVILTAQYGVIQFQDYVVALKGASCVFDGNAHNRLLSNKVMFLKDIQLALFSVSIIYK